MRIHRPILAATVTVALMVLATGAAPVAADPPIEDCDIVGTEGDDVIDEIVGSWPVICALGGNDTIILPPNRGGFRVYAGPGDDTVLGGEVRTGVVFGGEGHDTLKAYPDQDKGVEYHGGPGNDVLHGGLGQDALFGGPGTDTVYGYERRDRLVGGKGSDLVVGGKGDDEMFGGSYDDVLIGGRGHDIIYGNRGKDRLYGNKGHDRLIASDGMADRLDGGPGVDRGRWDAKDRVRSVERRSRLK